MPRPAKGAVWPVSELAPLRNLAHGSVRADPKRQRGKEDRTVETLGSESIHPTLPRAATQPPRLRSALANRAPAASPLLALPLLSKNWMRLELQASVQELDEIRSFSDWNCKLSVPAPAATNDCRFRFRLLSFFPGDLIGRRPSAPMIHSLVH